MDSPSKNMYDMFRDEIWKELGPLDPNWFDVLTAQTSANEENVSDQEELCPNQERNFKTPLDKPAVDSQLFSTPKVFRRSRTLSPETEDEQSFTTEQEKEALRWTATQSPCLFRMSKQGIPDTKYGSIQHQSQDSFDLLHTPRKSPASYAKHISESLGAQMNPDISWTSSFNTPPAVPSTLILSKTDESPCPASVSADNTVVFVRKLFPSLSNAATVDVAQFKHNDMPAVDQGAVSPEADSHDSLQTSLNQSEGVWRQKLPDAIEDGEIRTTVASVLDGAENVLSIFFANSSSALRKVKPNKTKRKQLIPTKEHGCSSTDISTANNAASSEGGTADQEPGTVSSSPPEKTGDTEITQWSPLSLSDISPSAVDNNILTGQLKSCSDSGQLVMPPMKIADSGLNKKKRKFVYTVGTMKTQSQANETQSKKMISSPGIPDSGQELSLKQLWKASGGADCCTIGQKQVNIAAENRPPSVQANVQDLDMSQLHRDFAQDFSQVPDSGIQSKVAEDTRIHFSPSACLSAVKQAKQKAKQANLHHDCDGVSGRRLVSATNQNYSTNEGTVSDSGFLSSVTDVTHTTASSFVVPSSENTGQSQQCSGFKTDIHRTTDIRRTTPFPPTNKENRKVHLGSETESELSSPQSSHFKEKKILDPGRESGLQIESIKTQLLSSTKGAVDSINCIPLNSQIHGHLPEETAFSLPSVSASGFKTASNKSIRISVANLEKAKHLFEESQSERTFSGQLTKSDHATNHKISTSNGPEESTTSNSNQQTSLSETSADLSCQLTASQKADVSELCTLLEEADSQFEFSQVKIPTVQQHCQDDVSSPQKADKELDHDFLTGIDFDDSFSSDAEKQLAAVIHDKVTSVSKDKTNSETSNITSKSTGVDLSRNVSFSSEYISEGSSCVMSTKPKNLQRAEQTEASKLENKNPLMLGVAFKTAGGNILRVSKTSLSKARALFADIQENLIDQKPLDKQNSEMDDKTKQRCNVDSSTGKDDSKFTLKDNCRVGERIQGCFSNMESADCSDKQFTSVPDKDAARSFKSDEIETTMCQSGFHMASGKVISISAKYMQQADAFFNDCAAMDQHDGISVKYKKSTEPVSERIDCKKNLSKFKSPLQFKISEEHVSGRTDCEIVNAEWSAHRTKEPHPDDMKMKSIGFNGRLPSKSAVSFHGNLFSTSKPFSSPLCTTSKNIDSSAIDELSSCDGFSTASGKKVPVSADALKKAENVLKEICTLKDTNKPLNQKENCPSTGQLVSQTHVLAPKDGGFKTASGNRVSISSAALKKAKSLFNECDEVDDELSAKPSHSKSPVHGPPPRNDGFLTASGKQVAISSEALQRAKSLFSDISAEIQDSSHTGNGDKKQEKMCFSVTAAGGDQVHVSQTHLFKEFDSDSSKAMQETDAFFKDFDMDGNCGMSLTCESVRRSASEKKTLSNIKADQSLSGNISEQPGHGCSEHTNKQGKQKEDAMPLQNCGFQTASGKGVAVSSAALKKAQSLFSECIEVEDKLCVKPSRSKSPVQGPPPRNHGFLTAGGKQVALSSEALEKAKSVFSDISCSADVEQDNGENTEKIHCGFTTAGGHKVHVSQKNLLKAKHLLSEFDSVSTKAMQEADGFFKDCQMDCGNAMSVKCRGVAPLSRSDNQKKTLSKMKPDPKFIVNASEQAEDGCTEHTNKQEKPKEHTLPPPNGGFQTASGKGVAVSSEALKKAQILFSECEKVENKIGFTTPHSKTPVPAPSFRNSGFLAASGKPVALSSEALQKAKALFSDISLSTDITAVSDIRKSDEEHKDAQNNTEKMHCGFTTAGGAKVHVSEQSLLKANNLLKDFSDEECLDSRYSGKSPCDTLKLDVLKMKDVNQTSNSDLATASDKAMLTKESASSVAKSAPTDAFRFQKDKILPLGAENLHDSLGKEMPCVLDYEKKERSSNKVLKVIGTDESSVLNFQSLNLTGCTETQQQFLAQEALDCTKALLEDEGLAGQSLSVNLENMPQEENPQSSNTSAEDEKRRGKRSVEDSDMTGQPPLKRRLLEEFDRTVDRLRGSTLHPVKSSPNGVMRDRRVFKYSVSLQPNITGPHRTGENFVETKSQKTTQQSTPGDGRSAHSKMPAFVPPFIKNTTTETRKNAALKDKIRTPSVFVPPFKKQRTVVQESSSEPQEEENKHLFVVPSNSSTYGAPGTRDVTALVDTASDNMMNIQSRPGGCGSVISGAETSHVEDTFSRSREVYQNLQSIELARDMQDMRIRKKKRQTIRPLPGSLFLTKTSGVARIPLKVAVNGKPPARYTQKQLYEYGVHKHVSDITGETAESFRFNLLQFIKKGTFTEEGGVQLADGGWLIPSKDGTAGKEEFYRSLCDTPGVDPKLISEAWVYNHYRWIVWKQASMEKSFPEAMGGLCLTPEQVLLQLKYRYDVEVDHSRRPALRKIMEKDDTSAKTMILCVCEIVSRGQSPNRRICSDTKNLGGADAKVEAPSAVVWLTDGWYAIKAQLDEPLTAMLHKGRLSVGGKLIIHGAQLVGSQDACSPLEAPESLMLKICANSSRPARWDAKLGFHRDPRPFLLPVSCLFSNGGPVGCVDIIILRSYPIQWMERKPDRSVVFRSVRSEEKEVRRYNSHKQKAMEILFAKIQAEFEQEEKGNKKPQQRRQTRSLQNIASLQDGEDLYEAVGDDPAYLEAHLSERQLEALHTYRRSLVEKKQAEMQDRYRRALEAEDSEGSCPKRDVTPVWRLCITDSKDQHGSVYQLSLWRPSSDLQSLLKEGCRYKVYNLTTSEGKKRSSVETVQLTGTKKTQIEYLQASQEWLSARFQPRVSTNFVILQNPEFQPLCGEVDLTGYVISIIDSQGSSPAFYLADGNLNFVKVRCFSSWSQSGLEDVVKPNVMLALSNLQLRGQSMHPTPVVYAGDLTVFSTNPKEAHLQESLHQLKTLVQRHDNFFQTAEEKLSHLIRSDGLSAINPPALPLQTPASAHKDTKTSVTFQKPIRSLGSFTPVRNPPEATSSSEKDPRSMKRRRALDYLSRIPSPPPVSHLGVMVSPCINKTFNPPRRSATPSTLKTVQSPGRKRTNSLVEDEWVHDEELAMIDTQALHGGDVL